MPVLSRLEAERNRAQQELRKKHFGTFDFLGFEVPLERDFDHAEAARAEKAAVLPELPTSDLDLVEMQVPSELTLFDSISVLFVEWCLLSP
jgi:hypothetical protein